MQCASVLGLMLSTSNRVASVQSEPGQQNLLLQQPLGRKRGLRQVRTQAVNKPSLLLCDLVWLFLYVAVCTQNVDAMCPFYLIFAILVQSLDLAGTIAQIVAVKPDKSLREEVPFVLNSSILSSAGFFLVIKWWSHNLHCITFSVETEKAQSPEVHMKEMSEPWKL